MPFQMTHLCVAEKIAQNVPTALKSLPQFYLGVTAPDAVHNRPGYISDYKKASHLCVGEEKWGSLTNNDVWTENVLKFLQHHQNSPHYDFILGYCIHILTDIYNNMTVWQSFKKHHPDEVAKGYGGLYHLESDRVELALVKTFRNRKPFWALLTQSQPESLYEMISAEELQAHKDNVLFHWYTDSECPDLSSHQIVTLESTAAFIDDTVTFLMRKLPLLSV